MCEIGGDLQSQRDVHYEVKVPRAPSQRRGRLGRARRHTADAVRHWATRLASATPSTKPCSRFLGAKSAATSHRARSSMRPAKAGSKSTRDSTTTRSMSRTESSKFVSSKARAASRRQPRESSSTSPTRGRQPERRRPHRLRHSLRQRPGLRPAPLATALARRRLWRRAKHQQRCSQHACRALIHDRSQCPTPLRAGLLGPRVVSPHPQGLQGSHLNLS